MVIAYLCSGSLSRYTKRRMRLSILKEELILNSAQQLHCISFCGVSLPFSASRRLCTLTASHSVLCVVRPSCLSLLSIIKYCLLSGEVLGYQGEKFADLDYNDSQLAYIVIFYFLLKVAIRSIRAQFYSGWSVTVFICVVTGYSVHRMILSLARHAHSRVKQKMSSLRLVFIIMLAYFIFHNTRLSGDKNSILSRSSHRQAGEHLLCAGH